MKQLWRKHSSLASKAVEFWL